MRLMTRMPWCRGRAARTLPAAGTVTGVHVLTVVHQAWCALGLICCWIRLLLPLCLLLRLLVRVLVVWVA